LLTLRGSDRPRRGSDLKELHVISDGSVLIRDGILIEVGPTRRIENLVAARGAREINASGRIVMPGFVDSHTHLAFPPPGAGPGHAEALRLVRRLTGKRLRSEIREYLTAMARHGTITVEVKTGCGPDEAAEIKLLRALSSLDSDPIEVLPTFLLRLPADGGAAEIAWAVNDLLPKIRRRRLAKSADLACSRFQLSGNHYSSYFAAARELGLIPRVHASTLDPSAAISIAVRDGAWSVNAPERTPDVDSRLLAASRTMVTLTPGMDLEGAASHVARKLADWGAALALTTGFSPGQPGTFSMQTAVALATNRMGLSVEEALAAATINGAHALGCAGRTGSLEPGKAADLLIMNASDYRELQRHMGANLVHLTMKSGQPIYTEAEVSAPLRPARSRPRP
jgi:imidazolonepropionase